MRRKMIRRIPSNDSIGSKINTVINDAVDNIKAREGSVERNARRMEAHEEQEKKKALRLVTDKFAHINPLDPVAWAVQRKTIQYRDGGAGFIKWVEDFELSIEVFVDSIPTYVPLCKLSTEINPETGRTSAGMWFEQKKIALECLKIKPGTNKFYYRLLIFCWMRGEGKSLFVCVLQLWKFFCFPSQKIMLGANSKDQVKFVHYDIMRNIILNSPKLLSVIGERNIQEKEIRIKDSKGRIGSFIRSISSFSGIVSNISGYTFSEMFDMKNPKFFTQIDGSMRNVPNALGAIDSTVSPKEHVLYKMYKSYLKNEDPTLFFSYRCSPQADGKDFWNPEMTVEQLKGYKVKFPGAQFDQYFKNTWDAGSLKLFTPALINCCKYLGFDTSLGEHQKVLKTLNNCHNIEDNKELDEEEKWERIEKLKSPLIPVEKVFTLSTENKQPRWVTPEELRYLGELYDTDWAIMCGADRADPMKKDITKGARTILEFVAKGLPGSKSNPVTITHSSGKLRYLYFRLRLVHVVHNDIDTIKQYIEEGVEMYNGINTFCTERWGMWDVGDWCEDLDITFEPLTASYMKQKEGFSELYNIIAEGRFKSPTVPIPGSKREDIFVEESQLFDHNSVKKFYGSPEKNETDGVQDDSMFGLCWCIYGGRNLSVDDFEDRGKSTVFGEFHEGQKLVGDY